MKFVYLILSILFVFFSGCSGTGFEKRTTLIPDTIGISIGQEEYKGDTAAWRGGFINLTWELK